LICLGSWLDYNNGLAHTVISNRGRQENLYYGLFFGFVERFILRSWFISYHDFIYVTNISRLMVMLTLFFSAEI